MSYYKNTEDSGLPESIHGHMTDTQNAADKPGVAQEVKQDAVKQDPSTEQLARRLQKVSLVESPDAIENLIAEHSLLEDMARRVVVKAWKLRKSDMWKKVALGTVRDYKQLINKTSDLIDEFKRDIILLQQKQSMFESKHFETSGGVKSLSLEPIIHLMKVRHGMLELSLAMFRAELKSKRFQVYSKPINTKPIDCRLDDLHGAIDDTMHAMQELTILQEKVEIDPA